ncbi:hypothetical protein CG717_20460 [Streptomyces sp. CB02613]|nr:hypothetical protein CG717_20460 [Streptomyces sp. CB02613]
MVGECWDGFLLPACRDFRATWVEVRRRYWSCGDVAGWCLFRSVGATVQAWSIVSRVIASVTGTMWSTNSSSW